MGRIRLRWVEEQVQFEEMEAVGIDCSFKNLSCGRRKSKRMDAGRKIIRTGMLI